jgi:hypothetical protein
MRMRVNEPGQQSNVAEVNHFGAGRNLHGARTADRGDPIVRDDDHGIGDGRRAGAVDQARSLQSHNPFTVG